ncbi:MAG: histidinol dehydrogenase [Synechococcus sp. SB0666_bin_14]|nr:histidinol dehydrogenase [Synechococcus sp. SB0666_bin_14]MYA90286.1 histidinol dehydrogenase [Synechococcus sp. SB0663_bin_10]MYG47471.1 histidinol dehydrogenase [Synechococcus sp. SB0675_bin_6]MYJ58929.1 histidinol dehydrogenase [Synechococcus sp. SB0672_bin_6]MYK91027.1 histidinol dehydrogenase [Synechococcus sp. SB0669_bin_8]
MGAAITALPGLSILQTAQDARARLRQIAARLHNNQQHARQVETILAAVREQGDAALLDFTARFDGQRFAAQELLVAPEAGVRALASLPAELRLALEAAHSRIEAFHRQQRPPDIDMTGPYGERLQRRWRPMARAGLYIPGGRAAYPSTVLMNAVPAKVAGVEQVVMVTPPSKDGSVNPVVLAAAALAGVDQIYRIGGAQAIAALAYGTETVPAVDVITGPGNVYVTMAKKAVYGTVAIDALAGPSEVLVIADETASPELVAADLLAQAEHDPLAAAIVLTTSDHLLSRLPSCLAQQLDEHPKPSTSARSLQDWGLAAKVATLAEAVDLANEFAPEHLELLVAQPDELLPRIRHAGAVFIGPETPEAVGDYLAGPNHTLPTSGTARFAGALGVEAFMTNMSLIRYTHGALEATGQHVMAMAASEGLHSHGESVRRRLKTQKEWAESKNQGQPGGTSVRT